VDRERQHPPWKGSAERRSGTEGPGIVSRGERLGHVVILRGIGEARESFGGPKRFWFDAFFARRISPIKQYFANFRKFRHVTDFFDARFAY